MIQDVNASTEICMSRIRDFSMYSKMVPHVKNVEIYDNVKFTNVSISPDIECYSTLELCMHLFMSPMAAS